MLFSSVSPGWEKLNPVEWGLSSPSVTPWSRGMETLLRHIYAGRKYSHVYTLSISTGKNQSTEARNALYIPMYEYNYKVITRCDKYYKNIISPIGANARIQRGIQVWKVQIALTSLQKEKSRDAQGAWKDRASDDLLVIHSSSAPLWSATGRTHKLQTLRPEHEDPEESELPSKLWCKC